MIVILKKHLYLVFFPWLRNASRTILAFACFMLIIGLDKINVFARKHANSRKSLATWEFATVEATWKNKHELLKDFPRAKMMGPNLARFEIVHNLYRLVAKIDYFDQIVEIRFIGTHNECDKINPENI